MIWLTGETRMGKALLVLYYFAVIVALIAMYGRGDFSTPPFIYQAF
jgi:hypothetical protein